MLRLDFRAGPFDKFQGMQAVRSVEANSAPFQRVETVQTQVPESTLAANCSRAQLRQILKWFDPHAISTRGACLVTGKTLRLAANDPRSWRGNRPYAPGVRARWASEGVEAALADAVVPVFEARKGAEERAEAQRLRHDVPLRLGNGFEPGQFSGNR
jgi:hypothetical protein